MFDWLVFFSFDQIERLLNVDRWGERFERKAYRRAFGVPDVDGGAMAD